jgi:FdhE protein
MGGDVPLINIGEQALVEELPPRPSFAQRIQRAHDLAQTHTSASELLRFYARVAFLQQHVFDSLQPARGELISPSDPWPLAIDLLLPHFSGFAISLAEIAPDPMSARVSVLASAGAAEQKQLLTTVWQGGPLEEETAASDQCLALAFLQPYAELLASLRETARPSSISGTCPICASEPVCSVLRDRGHGAGRSLVCSLCMTEWRFLRVACPACGEDRFESLPVYTREDLPQVRIDACDTCKHYVKTVDMTKDGLAVPVVDELAAVSLDLWAKEHGYQKLTANLVGI